MEICPERKHTLRNKRVINSKKDCTESRRFIVLVFNYFKQFIYFYRIMPLILLIYFYVKYSCLTKSDEHV